MVEVFCVTRILSLHSETEILELLHIVLKRGGYEHLSTTNPNTALTILREQNIDLLIQNLMRPNINGCVFYDIMQNDTDLRHIPVLIISTINPLSYPVECAYVIQNLYPDHYILLPFSTQVLLNTVRRILSE